MLVALEGAFQRFTSIITIFKVSLHNVRFEVLFAKLQICHRCPIATLDWL